jgi:two-component system, OmpR family, response regulator
MEQSLKQSSGAAESEESPAQARVLVVEDEAGIADFLERGLGAAGFEVQVASDGVDGEARALNDTLDIVILDMMLPGRSGAEILDTLRERKPELPVIVLTARGEVRDRIAGLDAGAVDYLVKPFALAELVARVRAQLRSSRRAPPTELKAGDIEVDLISREVRRGGEPVRLSATEFELLVFLMRNRRRVVSREQILRAVWGYEHDPGTNIVEVYMGYLRRKLRQGRAPGPIVTVRSVGYRLDDAP